MWKKVWPYILYPLMIAMGLLFLLYPLVSNYRYEQKQDTVLAQYESISQDSTLLTARKNALEQARAYNAQLASGVVSLADPFRTATLPLADGSQRSVLDLDGTGVIASLKIASLDLLLPVYYGTDAESLKSGIGVLEGSSLPVGGAGSHTVLCGHSGLSTAKLFTNLNQLEVGDVFSLSVLGEHLYYQVDRIQTVLPDGVEALAIDPAQDYCTLLTCTPYGVNTHRLLIRGVRIDPPEATEADEVTTEDAPQMSTWVKEYLFSLGASLAVVVVFFVLSQLLAALWRRHRSLS